MVDIIPNTALCNICMEPHEDPICLCSDPTHLFCRNCVKEYITNKIDSAYMGMLLVTQNLIIYYINYYFSIFFYILFISKILILFHFSHVSITFLIKPYKLNETVQFTIEAVQKYTHLFWAPPSNINFNNLNTSSCFDHKLFQSNSSNKLEFNNISYPNFNDNLYASITLDLYPTNKQHCILQGWFLVIIKMYNITIKLLKSNLFFSKIQKLKRLIQLEKQYKPDFDRLILISYAFFSAS